MIGFRCSVFGVLIFWIGRWHTTTLTTYIWRRIAKHYRSDHLFFGDADYLKAIRYFQQRSENPTKARGFLSSRHF